MPAVNAADCCGRRLHGDACVAAPVPSYGPRSQKHGLECWPSPLRPALDLAGRIMGVIGMGNVEGGSSGSRSTGSSWRSLRIAARRKACRTVSGSLGRRSGFDG
ncbi:hypothetical protein F2981_27760 (plasmid) [Sinorhizobium meliloti]|nr:hypothetical protein [Sinorhizobium meliloti]